MSTETVFLGVIAMATTVMALIQLAAAVYAARAAKEATVAARELRQELGPILANARKATDDAARITALALTQVERVDSFVSTTTARVDETLAAVQDVIMGPLRQGSAVMAGLKTILGMFLSRRRREPAADDEDENLFIG